MPLSELPCSGLGAKPDVDLTVRTMAFLIPTDTFRGKASFTVRSKEGGWHWCVFLEMIGPLNVDIASPMSYAHAHNNDDERRRQAGGLTFELVEAHGETHDQLFVYIPEKKTLLPGDNYYESFPNLYTVRGTSPRCVVWSGGGVWFGPAFIAAFPPS